MKCDDKSEPTFLSDHDCCMSINGYGGNNKPIILSIKYLYENNKWVIDYIEVYYADSKKEFQTKGTCPSES